MTDIGSYLKKTSLTFRIVSGLVLGILTGLFLGEKASSLQTIADIWIGLMQMTVLPYVMVSLISGLGQLDATLAKLLAVKGGLLMLLFWAIAFVVIMAMPMAFPKFLNASFFSAHASEVVTTFDPVGLYIPANPFHAMANTIIPAVVIFSAAVGIALIGMPKKAALIESLVTFLEALGRVTRFVVALTPIGVFAIVAVAAGTMTWEEIIRLEAYFIVYIVASLYLALWVIPVLISILTPFRYRDVFRYSKEALLTAFIAQNVFIILPMLIEASRKLYSDYGLSTKDTDSLSEVIVPVTFNFPNTGKLLSLLFVPFAAWLSGSEMELASYPGFLFSGLGSYFAKAQVALPFLLDTQRIPQDLFQLYLPTGIINGKFDTMVSAMNLLAFSVIGTAALTGNLKVSPRKIIQFLVISFVLLVLAVSATRMFLSATIDTTYHGDEIILGMSLIESATDTRVFDSRDDLPPGYVASLPDKQPILDQITQRGVLRAGYIPNRLPFTFRNEDEELVGFDVELLSLLARELDVRLEMIPLSWQTLKSQISSDEVDIVGSMPLTTHMMIALDLSDAYLPGDLSVIVRDHRRKEFSSLENIRALGSLTIAYPGPLEFIKPAVIQSLPDMDLTWLEIDRFEEFFEQEDESIDTLIVEAEIGTAWTLLHPEYAVIVPKSSRLKVPLGFAVARGQHDFAAMLGRWLTAKKSTGQIQEAYDYWVLGKGAEKTTSRWSIGKDVLGWWDN
jgi:Na+/H+-dicarboxylate symporter/ABC-type amino acid transport substrate-binding protein